MNEVRLTDLRGITRDSEHSLTEVHLWTPSTRLPWLQFGQARIRHNEGAGTWEMRAYLTEDVTDVECDPAFALQLPLIGTVLRDVDGGRAHIIAWIDPSRPDSFRVPLAGYDPAHMIGASTCGGRCGRPAGHITVPDGFYLPPHLPALFRAVAGKKLEISIGPIVQCEES